MFRVRQSLRFLRLLGSFRRIEPEDGFAFLHHIELIAGDDLDVFLVVLEEVNFALALFALRLESGQFLLVLQQVAGHLISAHDFGIEPEHDAGDSAGNNQGQQDAIESIPE